MPYEILRGMQLDYTSISKLKNCNLRALIYKNVDTLEKKVLKIKEIFFQENISLDLKEIFVIFKEKFINLN